MSRALSPSTTLSFRFTWLTSTLPKPAREAVVLARDLRASSGDVDHRLVDPPVAERQLVGAEAECPPQQLVAEADAEERQPLAEHDLQQLHLRIGRRRVTRSV